MIAKLSWLATLLVSNGLILGSDVETELDVRLLRLTGPSGWLVVGGECAGLEEGGKAGGGCDGRERDTRCRTRTCQ